MCVHSSSLTSYTIKLYPVPYYCCTVRPPDAIGEHIGLGSRQCQDVAGLQLLDEQLRERLRQQVPGWRINNNKEGLQCIRQVRESACFEV
jgi:hypothetical protein